MAGLWDECWLDIEVYDASVTTSAMSYVPTVAEGQPDGTRLSQLGSALGRSHNLGEMLAARQTRALQWALPALAALVGAAAARTRRLEHASARHVGVAAPDLAATTVLESLVWTTAAALLATAAGGITHVALYRGAGLDPTPSLLGTLGALAVPALLAGFTACGGAAITAGLTNPRLLYRYFRQR